MSVKAPSKTAWRKAGLEIVAAVRRVSAIGSRIPEMPGLTYLDFAVLVALSEWLDGEALCYRSYQDIANDCGCSVTAVKQSIKRLIAAGLLEKPKGIKKTGRKKGPEGSDGGRPANTYRAVMPRCFRNHASRNDQDSFGNDAYQNRGEVLVTSTAQTSDASAGGLGNHASLGFGKHGSPHIERIRRGGAAEIIEELPEGAGARSRAPQAQVAPVTSVVLIDEDNNTAVHQDRAPEAVDPPLGAPAADLVPLDAASDLDHPRVRPFAPVAEADAPLPGNDARKAEVRDYECQTVTESDLDALADEEAEAARCAEVTAGGGWSWEFLDDEPDQAEMEVRRSSGLSQIAAAFGAATPDGLGVSELAEMFSARHVDGAQVTGWPDVVRRLADAEATTRIRQGDYEADVWRRTVLCGLGRYAEGVGASRQIIDRATAAFAVELDSFDLGGVSNG